MSSFSIDRKGCLELGGFALKGAPRIVLSKGDIVSLRPDRELEIVCHQGELWITQTGDDRDVFLVCGQSQRFNRRGMIVLQPLTMTSLSIR